MKYKYFSLLLALCLFCACASVGLTGRKQLMLISEEQESALGLQSYDEVLKTAKISKDAANTALINKVGRRIAAASGQNYDWQFTLIEDKQVNAFCMPGGKVAVYTGILPYTKDENGLAVVMAHEVAHALARHGAERMSQTLILQGGLTAAALALEENKNKALILGAFGAAGTVGVMLPYSRKHEYEADRMGLILMAKAGYDPRGAVGFWQRMSTANGKVKEGSPISGFLSTHPSDDNRIKAIQEHLPEALSYYGK